MTVIQPQGAPHLYKTYEISAPLATHWRPATCEEIACAHYVHGWTTTVDTSTELGQRQAIYIAGDRSRRKEVIGRDGDMISWSFPSGQTCFRASQHKLPLDREANYRILAGDRRQFTAVRPVTARAWVDDFGEHQQRVAELHQRG